MEQFVLARTCSDDYKKCDDQSLKEVMVQMSIELFVSVRAVRELHSKEIDRYMINNVRIRARR